MYLIFTTSLRPGSHSKIMANLLLNKLKEKNQDAELIDLAEIELPLCDGDKSAVGGLASSKLKKRAIGVRRAAADCHGLAGSGLLTLLRNRRWEVFEALAEEPPEFHMSARGRRRDSGPQSPILEALKIGSISMHSR